MLKSIIREHCALDVTKFLSIQSVPFYFRSLFVANRQFWGSDWFNFCVILVQFNLSKFDKLSQQPALPYSVKPDGERHWIITLISADLRQPGSVHLSQHIHTRRDHFHMELCRGDKAWQLNANIYECISQPGMNPSFGTVLVYVQVGFVYLAMTKCFQHLCALVHPRVRRERAVQIWGGFLGGTSLECGNIPASVKNVDHSSCIGKGDFLLIVWINYTVWLCEHILGLNGIEN